MRAYLGERWRMYALVAGGLGIAGLLFVAIAEPLPQHAIAWLMALAAAYALMLLWPVAYRGQLSRG